MEMTREKQKKLKTMSIPISNPPRVLLIGNGPWRAFDEKASSWDNLICKICAGFGGKHMSEKAPFPLQVIAASKNMEEEAKDFIAKKFVDGQGVWSRDAPSIEGFFQKLLALGFDAVLTTNYTYEIEHALNPAFTCAKRSGFRKTLFYYADVQNRRISKEKDKIRRRAGKMESALFQAFFVQREGEKLPIWHIHGEVCRPKTMLLGQYYYGSMIGMARAYVPEVIARYARTKGEFRGVSLNPDAKDTAVSWVDYFLTGEVYSVGFGFDLSEIDLWWLVDCKRRHFSNTRLHIFTPSMSDAAADIAAAYGLDVHDTHAGHWSPSQYQDYYWSLLKEIPSRK